MTSLPSFESSDEPNGHNYRRRYKQEFAYANSIWQRWLLEYVPTLTTRRKWDTPSRELKTGDLVWISDTTSPRNYLRLHLLQLFKYTVVPNAQHNTLHKSIQSRQNEPGRVHSLIDWF